MRALAIVFLLWSSLATGQETGSLLTTPVGSTPVPDPTKLTQEAVDRAKQELIVLFKVQLDALTQRFDRLQISVDARPTEVDKTVEQAIANLQALMNEKFKGVADQFAGRDVALAAALLAQKTAVDEQNKSNALSISKSDAATAKQIETIASSSDSKTGAINEKVDDLRQRVQAIESRALGGTDTSANIWGFIFAAVGAVGTLFGLWALTRQHSLSSRRP